MIKVEFSSSIKRYTNGDLECSFDNCIAKNLFEKLINLYPDIGNILSIRENELKPFVSMFINGVQCKELPNKFNSNNVKIKFIMAVAGG